MSSTAGDLTPAQQAELPRLLTSSELIDNDLAWIQPLIDEAEAEIERGDIVTFEELKAHLNAQAASGR